MKWALLLSPLYGWGNWNTDKIICLNSLSQQEGKLGIYDKNNVDYWGKEWVIYSVNSAGTVGYLPPPPPFYGSFLL